MCMSEVVVWIDLFATLACVERLACSVYWSGVTTLQSLLAWSGWLATLVSLEWLACNTC